MCKSLKKKMATRKHCIASIFMSCSVFMSELGRSIDNDSAALINRTFYGVWEPT
jgi:hypothetical protein